MALWDPSLITTKLWLDASNAGSITESSGAVSQWDDLSGNGYTFSQASGSLQPTTGTETLNSLNVVYFNDDYLTSDSVASTWSFLHDGTEHQIYTAVRFSDVSVADDAYTLLSTATGAVSSRGFHLSWDDRPSIPRDSTIVHTVSNGTTIPVNNATADNFILGNTPSVLGVQSDPNNGTAASRSEIRLAGNTAVTNNTFTNSPSASDPASTLRVGARSDGTQILVGSIAEIIVVIGAADTEIRQTIEGYLAWKWGLEGSLPAGHPWETEAPTNGPQARASVPGPLQAPETLAAFQVSSNISVSTPLQAPALLSAVEVDAYVQVPSPLQPPSAVGYQLSSFIVIPGPLQFPLIEGSSDFSAAIKSINPPPPTYYLAELDGSPVLRIPIRSWQATLQLSSSQYVQCVIPSADDYIDTISSRLNTNNFTIYCAFQVDGIEIKSPVATALMQFAPWTQGPINLSVTLQGYVAAATAPASPATRTMTGVRQIGVAANGLSRARCDIDWFLVPGDTVIAGGVEFTASYISYYVVDQGQQEYMDVGER